MTRAAGRNHKLGQVIDSVIHSLFDHRLHGPARHQRSAIRLKDAPAHIAKSELREALLEFRPIEPLEAHAELAERLERAEGVMVFGAR